MELIFYTVMMLKLEVIGLCCLSLVASVNQKHLNSQLGVYLRYFKEISSLHTERELSVRDLSMVCMMFLFSVYC